MWGTNAKDEKVLVALALRAADNVVDLFVFPFDATSEEFYNLMLNEWRENHEVSFPEGFTHIERPLTAADSLLPEDIRVDRGDVIQRAQTEWHFIVLSHKLYETFRQDIEAIGERIKSAGKYSNQLWEEMKTTWERVQKHIFDKTLLREHGQQLRDMTNETFTYLKNIRKETDSEADRASREVADQFNARLDAIEEKIKAGAGLQPLFNDLKQLQQEFGKANLARGDRNKLWKRIDNAFKAAKERKGGDRAGGRDSSTMDRISRRLEGLLSAIDKMEKSIKRDEKDRHFQDDRIANTEGQLEAQIRMAKLKMIEERMTSKQEKLDEMLKTKAELEQRIEREKKFLEEQRRQQEIKEQLKEAKEAVKQKIAGDIQQHTGQVDEEALRKAAEAIAAQQAGKGKRKESLLGAIGETIGESLEDLGDTLGAVTTVVAGKIGEAFQDLKEEAAETADDIGEGASKVGRKVKDFVQDAKEEVAEKAEDMGEGLAAATDKVKQVFQDLKEDAAEKAEDVGEGLAAMTEKAKHVFHDLKEDAAEKAEDVGEGLAEMTDKAKHVFHDLKENAAGKAEDAGEGLAAMADKAKQVFHDLKENATEKAEDAGEGLAAVTDKIKHFVSELKEELSEKAEDIGEGAAAFSEKVKAFAHEVKEEVDETLEGLNEKMQQDKHASGDKAEESKDA